jgi:hypothetical protein
MAPVKRGASEIALLVLLMASGCRFSPPPVQLQPESPAISFAEKDGTVHFQRWKDGRAFMLCCDIAGGAGSTGISMSGPPQVWKAEGDVSANDGRRLDWRLELTDGRNLKCWVNGKEYDMSKGGLFLVKTKSGKTEVEQIDQDLSAVPADVEGCRSFVRKDPAISKLLGIEGE